MATEENTTDSTSTTGTAPTENQSPPASDTSTTETTDQSKTEDTPETILTEKPSAETEGEDDKEDTRTDEQKAADEARAAFYGAPEGDYEVSGLPEGMEVDKDALAAVTPIAKELNLSNEGFSKIAGVYAEKVLPAVQEQLTDGIERAVAAKHAEWAQQAKEMISTDPVFEGKKLSDVQAVAAKAMDRFFGADTRQFLADSGLGNYPELVKGMYLIGNAISEDTSFERGSSSSQPKSRTEKYYGKQ